MEEHQIDRLARHIATSTSRRQMLKILAGAAVGTFAGSRTAYAANMTCAQFCTAVFGGNTSAQAQCAADAAHHKGLCYSCGPKKQGGGVSPSDICCTRNSRNVCTSYSSATCCSGGQICQNGTCVTPCLPNGSPVTDGSSGCSACCSKQCASNAQGVTICCQSQGGSCTQDSECCGQLFCLNGTCTPPCEPAGGACITAADCCSRNCTPVAGSLVGTCA